MTADEPRAEVEPSLARGGQRRRAVRDLAQKWAAEIAVELLPEWHPGHQDVRAMILDHAMGALWPLVRVNTTKAQVRAALVNLRSPDRSWKEVLVALRNHEVREHNRSPKKLRPLQVFKIAEAYSLLDDRLTVADVDVRSWRRAVKRAEKATGRRVPRAVRRKKGLRAT